MRHLITITAIVSLQIALTSASVASQRMDDGLTAYQANCAACHETGLEGAPRTSEPEDWANRSLLWEAIQVVHAEKGYLNMPAKGGDKNMSDYDVDVAAEYMLNISHPDFPQD